MLMDSDLRSRLGKIYQKPVPFAGNVDSALLSGPCVSSRVPQHQSSEFAFLRGRRTRKLWIDGFRGVMQKPHS